ncbi:MAG TPA: hypothetical protein DFR83_01855 [Deltaproteobacteria bacterium]|nr:hypothetical protein [Deltaproteobacteria bacterium]
MRHVDDHNELDRLVARVPEALDHIGRRAVDCAMQGCRAAMADWADAVVGRLLAAASWATPPASQAPQVLELGVAGGMLARSAAGRVQAAAPPALLGMVRLRRVEVRRSALEAAWADALSELQIDLGAALRDGLGTVEAALQATAHALTTHMEAAGQEALVAEARCRTAERLATWAARDWLTGETAQRPTVAPLRTL